MTISDIIKGGMANCRHTDWIRLWKNADTTGVEVTDRPRRLLDTLRDPEKEYPTLLVFIGNQSKQLVLKRLGSGAEVSRRRGHGEVHLSLSALRIFQNSPVVIADCDIPVHYRLPRAGKTSLCHEVASEHLPPDAKRVKVVGRGDLIFRRAVLPFADVICIFVEEIGGINRSLMRLVAWATLGPTSIASCLPRVLLVVQDAFKTDVENMVNQLQCHHPALKTCFAQISVIGTVAVTSEPAKSKDLSAAGWRSLRGQIVSKLKEAHFQRSRASCMFSALHFSRFLQMGADNIKKRESMPFDFVSAAREHNEVPPAIASHVNTFLDLFHSPESMKTVAVPLIASSFILDQYPPGMHAFDPQIVFRTLYKELCPALYRRWRRNNMGERRLPHDFESLLQKEMIKRFKRFQQLGSSKDAHVELLIRMRRSIRNVASDATCLVCLRRRPQTTLPCGHSICYLCLSIFCHHDARDPGLVCIRNCLVCSTRLVGVTIRKPPHTAKIRILSLDGGGIRGAGELECLAALESQIGLPYPVIRHFDVCFATSCGVGIMLKLCDGADVLSCKAYFKDSARQAFRPRMALRYLQKMNVPWLYNLALTFILLCTDSKYPSNNLDKLLEEEYGTHRRIMDHSLANETGITFGLTLTEAGSTDTVIVTNYNGVGAPRNSKDYDVLETKTNLRSIPLWELVRSAVAAPFYFTPHHLANIGTFQDGGLTFNNPISIAEQEAMSLYPKRGRPGIVVSLGTGYSCQLGEREEKVHTGSFIKRLYQAFSKSMDSGAAWNRYLSQTHSAKTGDRYRLDFVFPSTPPALDDEEKVDHVASVARASVIDSVVISQLANSLRAQLFYFELDSTCIPQYSNGSFACDGYIVCRLSPGTEPLKALLEQLSNASAYFRAFERTLPIRNMAPRSIPYGYRKAVRFHVASRISPFSITLIEQEGTECQINGSPFTIDWLLTQQQLDAPFGKADHSKKRGRVGGLCQQRKRSKICAAELFPGRVL